VHSADREKRTAVRFGACKTAFRWTDRQLDRKEEQQTVTRKAKINKKKKACKERKESKCKNECNEKGRTDTRMNVSGEAAASIFRVPCFTQIGGRTFHHSSCASLSFHSYCYY
jgi:hypothetical protein